MRENGLDSGNLKKDYIRFAVPTVLSLLVFSLYSMVDGIFVGRLIGPQALAAVNLGAPVLNVLFSVAVLLAVGSSTIIASAMGAGERERAGGLFTQNLVAAAAVGLLIAAAAESALTPVCRLLGAQEDTLADTRAYVGALAPFSVSIILEYNLEVLIKTDGHPRLAAVTVLCASVLHAGLDWLLLDAMKLGVRGAALATGLSETAAALIFLTHFTLSRRHTLRLTRFRFDWRIYRRLVPIGVPDGAAELCTGLMTWLFNRTILRCVGTDGVASYTVITYVNNLVMNVLLGASQGMQPLVSYHRGRGDEEKCRALLRYAMTAGAVLSAAVFAALFGFAPQVVTVFIPGCGTDLWTSTVAVFRHWCFSFLPMGFNIVAAGYLTARERPGRAICVSVGRGLVLQAAALGLLTGFFGGAGIWWTTLVSESVCLALSLAMLKSAQTAVPAGPK
jgi:putative MATE family efflux protein